MLEQSSNFYTPSGIHVYTKDDMMNDLVDLEGVVSKLESTLPDHLRDGVEMIIIGQFEEFAERDINAFYKDGALYVSNFQTDNNDLLDDLIHETAHSVEEQYGMEIYNMLSKMKLATDKQRFMDTEYEQEFDEYLFDDVGYDRLSEVLRGVVVTPYAMTSLREYFATAFTEFYFQPDSHNYIKRVSPELYRKLVMLHQQGDA